MKSTGKQINWTTKERAQLLEAFLALQNKDEFELFLRDLLTENEIDEFSNRLETARLLSINTPYSAIVKKTSLSSTTVARISKWLFGSFGGYRLILERITTPHTNSSSSGRGLYSNL